MDSIGQQPSTVNLFNTDPTVCRICNRRYDMQQTFRARIETETPARLRTHLLREMHTLANDWQTEQTAPSRMLSDVPDEDVAGDQVGHRSTADQLRNRRSDRAGSRFRAPRKRTIEFMHHHEDVHQQAFEDLESVEATGKECYVLRKFYGSIIKYRDDRRANRFAASLSLEPISRRMAMRGLDRRPTIPSKKVSIRRRTTAWIPDSKKKWSPRTNSWMKSLHQPTMTSSISMLLLFSIQPIRFLGTTTETDACRVTFPLYDPSREIERRRPRTVRALR